MFFSILDMFLYIFFHFSIARLFRNGMPELTVMLKYSSIGPNRNGIWNGIDNYGRMCRR